MNCIVDENLPPRLARWLRAKGIRADHVRDIGLREASDEEICAEAASRGATIITQDRDFDALATAGRARVIRLTMGNMATEALIEWVAARWPMVEGALRSGDGLVVI